jgi:hypothetical protein
MAWCSRFGKCRRGAPAAGWLFLQAVCICSCGTVHSWCLPGSVLPDVKLQELQLVFGGVSYAAHIAAG